MATIEPRLIHLLNESNTPQPTNAALPSMRPPPQTPKTSEGPLPPLEPEASNRDGRDSSAQVFVNSFTLLDNAAPPVSAPRLYRPLGPPTAPSSLPKLPDSIGDPADDPTDDSNTLQNKRTRVPGVEDFVQEFLQLPQPVKKQKAAQQATVPPIINGLHEPPPCTPLLPPMEPTSFNNTDSTPMRVFSAPNQPLEEPSLQPPQEPTRGRARKRAAKPRRKWSEEETTNLLLGVNRHGVGKWTSILEDPDFTFNDRSAGDLKDRFRTCCPPKPKNESQLTPARRPATGTTMDFDRILRGDEDVPQPEGLPPEGLPLEGSQPEDLQPEDLASSETRTPSCGKMLRGKLSSVKPIHAKARKSRAHRKNSNELAALGIVQPFKKSERRERRPFTAKDDRDILEGLHNYGPSWTKIQRDKRFGLSTRQPTDLRDRVRNKYPDLYAHIDSVTFKLAGSNRTLEPSVEIQPSKAPNFESQMNRTSSREELLQWQPSIPSADPFNLELPEASVPPPPVGATPPGEMDLSRLILDDTRYLLPTTRFNVEGTSGPPAPAPALAPAPASAPAPSQIPLGGWHRDMLENSQDRQQPGPW